MVTHLRVLHQDWSWGEGVARDMIQKSCPSLWHLHPWQAGWTSSSLVEKSSLLGWWGKEWQRLLVAFGLPGLGATTGFCAWHPRDGIKPSRLALKGEASVPVPDFGCLGGECVHAGDTSPTRSLPSAGPGWCWPPLLFPMPVLTVRSWGSTAG